MSRKGRPPWIDCVPADKLKYSYLPAGVTICGNGAAAAPAIATTAAARPDALGVQTRTSWPSTEKTLSAFATSLGGSERLGPAARACCQPSGVDQLAYTSCR